MIKALFIDLDGVIRIWDPKDIVKAETDAGLSPGSFWPVAFEPELLSKAITGKMSDEAWREEAGRRLQERYPEANAGLAIQAWVDMVGHVDADVVDMIRECRRHGPVSLISNATSRLSSDLKRMGIEDEFDHVFNTSELGVAKPDPEVFRIIMERVGVSPEQSFFVDDRPGNVEAAAQLGMHTHLHDGAEGLARALQRVGLLGGDEPAASEQ